MTRILIYDDNQARRESLEALITLTPALESAGSFENCKDVEQQVQALRPEVVLMDILMPESDGIDGLTRIKAIMPEVKVIMQTAFDDDDKVFKALKAGADGYLLKTANAAQIIQGIKDVLNGGAVMTPSIALKVMRYFTEKPALPKADYGLTAKEQEVLGLLAEGHSYKMVAEQLFISYFTVNNHVKNIYQKLHVHSLAEAVALGYKEGFLGLK